MHYSILETNLQKAPSAEGSPPPTLLNFRFWWPELLDLAELDFSTDYGEI